MVRKHPTVWEGSRQRVGNSRQLRDAELGIVLEGLAPSVSVRDRDTVVAAEICLSHSFGCSWV